MDAGCTVSENLVCLEEIYVRYLCFVQLRTIAYREQQDSVGLSVTPTDREHWTGMTFGVPTPTPACPAGCPRATCQAAELRLGPMCPRGREITQFYPLFSLLPLAFFFFFFCKRKHVSPRTGTPAHTHTHRHGEGGRDRERERERK